MYISTTPRVAWPVPKTKIFFSTLKNAPGLHPKYDYPTFIGGILLISRQVFSNVDGLSNHYWDRFYKTPFRPKSLRIIFHPEIVDKSSPKKLSQY
jgi:hypothetical protein